MPLDVPQQVSAFASRTAARRCEAGDCLRQVLLGIICCCGGCASVPDLSFPQVLSSQQAEHAASAEASRPETAFANPGAEPGTRDPRRVADGRARVCDLETSPASLAAWDQPPAAPAAGNAKADFAQAEPRIPLADAADRAIDVTAALARLYPDEYLHDGGDRDRPVHYDHFNRLGLDTQDTVAEYSDHTGKRHVRPSNRVAVYAPRFAAVRSVSQSETDLGVNRLASAFDTARQAGLRARTAPVHHRQNEAGSGVSVRSRASGLDHRHAQRGIEQATRFQMHEKLLNLYQDLSFLRTGQFHQAEEARLAYGLQAAFAWSRDESPVITAQLDSTQEVHAAFKPQQYVGVDDRHKSTGRLRIVKLADKQAAEPGDIVTFTIRYDNLGDRDLYHIRIVDNLTPRLEYVPDSATSDAAGRLIVHDNAEGSLVLEWELDEPLPGRQGGVVTFQARVR